MAATHVDIAENLKDAGCTQDDIDKFITYGKEKRRTEQMRLLEIHRRRLLENVHTYQRCIDRLDYLVYNMEKENP